MPFKKKTYSEWDQSSPAMPSKGRIEAAGREIKEDPPAILAKTARKKGKAAAHKQKVAIMLSKARRGK